MGRGLGAARPVPLVRMAVGGSGNRLVPLTGFALRVNAGEGAAQGVLVLALQPTNYGPVD